MVALAMICLAVAAVTVLAEKAKSKTVQLFNGKDLTNFYTYLAKYKYEDPNKVFTVVQEDGAPAIRVSGQDFGGFITQAEYENYHLIVEFKWGRKTWPPREGKAMDSGILLHCAGPDGNAGNGWMASVECQIIEGGCGDFILVGGKDAQGNPIKPSLTVECEARGGQLYYQPGGQPMTRNSGRFNWYGRDPEWRDVQGFRGKQDVESPAGQWTRMEVVCDGDRITNMVNGKVVNVGAKSSLAKGKILFQSEGAEIFYRKIELASLKK
jgi:hypothetical protein